MKEKSKNTKDYEKAEKLTGVSYNLTTRLNIKFVSLMEKQTKKEINEFR